MLRVLAGLPLSFFHVLGAALGRMVWLLSPRFRRLIRENLASAGYVDEGLRRRAVAEAGKGVLELIPVWFRPQEQAAALMREVHVGDLIEEARARGKGIIFVTPHLGCFEVTAQWYAHHCGPMTALFSPPRKSLVNLLMSSGREKLRLKLAAPDMRGIRALFRALKKLSLIHI